MNDQKNSNDATLKPVPPTPEEPPAQQKMLVTHLKTLERQVGEHVISALQIPDSAAVISMVYPAPQGGQNIVSIPLPAETWQSIRALLEQADAEAPGDMPCVGFHCYTSYADESKSDDADAGDLEEDANAPESDTDEEESP